MAPRTGRMIPRRQSHSPLENGDIPPSTLAAQIADRMVDGHHGPRDDDSENFQLLLQELLEASDATSQPESNIADDPAVNSRLIYVIVRAGLGEQRTGSTVDEQKKGTWTLSEVFKPSYRSYLDLLILFTIRSAPLILVSPLDCPSLRGFYPGSWLRSKCLIPVAPKNMC